MCEENKHSNENPYDITFKREWPYLLSSTALATVGYIMVNNPTTPYTQMELDHLDRNDINSFDRGATYNNNSTAKTASDILVVSSLIIMPSVFLFNHHTRSDIGSLLVLTYEVVSFNYGVTNIVKGAVDRTRPYAYNPDLSYEERTDAASRHSFYSGHTSVTASLSFLFAKVMTDYHPHMKPGYKVGIWSVAAILPATTGYLRIQAGKHYPTDVITGYAAGALTGWLIPHLHKNKKQKVSIYTTRLFNSNAIGFTLKL